VVTADGLLLELEVFEPEEPELEEPELEEPELPDESAEVVVPDDAPVSDPVAADAVVCVALDDVVVPIAPSYAIAPKASVKIASDTAVTRLRIRAMRVARARSFSRASCFGEGACSVGEVVCSVMAAR
jgi:hypothetical protein